MIPLKQNYDEETDSQGGKLMSVGVTKQDAVCFQNCIFLVTRKQKIALWFSSAATHPLAVQISFSCSDNL